MSISKGQFVADGAERVQSALKKHEDTLRRIIAEKYARQFASATPEEKRALEEVMRRELEEQLKRLKPSPFALYAAQ